MGSSLAKARSSGQPGSIHLNLPSAARVSIRGIKCVRQGVPGPGVSLASNCAAAV
jgi:hypothetical protein